MVWFSLDPNGWKLKIVVFGGSLELPKLANRFSDSLLENPPNSQPPLSLMWGDLPGGFRADPTPPTAHQRAPPAA